MIRLNNTLAIVYVTVASMKYFFALSFSKECRKSSYEVTLMPTRPNILLIFTDQQRADSIHALGNPVIQTPALDSLVCEGTSFTAAYTPYPVCIVARCKCFLAKPSC